MLWSSLWLLTSGIVGDVPGWSGTGHESTEMGTNVTVARMGAVMTRRLIPLAGDGKRAVACHVLGLQSRHELLEYAFDNSMTVFKHVFF